MTDSLPAKTTARLWMAAYFAATFGIGGLKIAGVIQGWPATALFLCSFLLLFPMARAVERAQAECGIRSVAMKRYNRRVLMSAMTYVVALLAGVSIVRHYEPATAIRVILAMAVALPVIMMIRAMALLLNEESDEYLRSRLVDQSLIATGFLLTVATLYGFLNTFDVAPRVDAWAAFPLWAIGLGIGRLVRREPSC